MSSSVVIPDPVVMASRTSAIPQAVGVWTRPDLRRTLQLVLATLWLLDGVLQLQAYFFTRAFGARFIPMVAQGNPTVIAAPIDWSGQRIAHHAVAVNTVFAVVQLALALGIAFRPTLRFALGTSIVWSLGVWWVGEGMGGVLAGAADPLTGAPGAAVLYGLAAVVLWPADRSATPAPFVAARALGTGVARAVWIVLWGSLAYFAVLGANRSSQGIHGLIAGLAAGEPGWLAGVDRHLASLSAGHGTAIAVVLAVVIVGIAVSVLLPPGAGNAMLVVAAVVSLGCWIAGQNFGGILTNGGTDLNSGPLLVLLAAAYWRSSSAAPAPYPPDGVT